MPNDVTVATQVVPSTELTDLSRSYARASRADNTRRAYAAQMKLWSTHAAAHEVPAFPADPGAVANWLAARAAAGQAYATLRTALAALRAGHVALGIAFDTRAPAIETVMRGIGRVHAREQRQVEPIRATDINEILAALGGDPRALRDGALLALGYMFGLRRSELVAIDLSDQGGGDGAVRIGAREVTLVLARSKTGVAGSVETVVIPRPPVATAVAAIERWVSSACIATGSPLLRRVDRSGRVLGRLHDQSVATIIKRRICEHLLRQGVDAAAAAAESARFAGHSLRVGFAVTAAEHGATADEIALVTRHRSLEMPRRYAAKADALRRSPYRRSGVGTD